MCTVTFIPVRDNYFITSSRDEKTTRQPAAVPCVYRIGNKKIIYPKDGEAGGSWIAMRENGDAAVLLNGAFKKHPVEPRYRLSRGKILLEIIAGAQPVNYFLQLALSQIEPFTLVLLEENKLYECRWDGNHRHCRQLETGHPYIWTSVTLYDDRIIKKREEWFAAFLNNNPGPAQKDIVAFHRFTGDGDTVNDLLMEKENTYATVSITSMLLTARNGSMKYIDLRGGGNAETKMEFGAFRYPV